MIQQVSQAICLVSSISHPLHLYMMYIFKEMFIHVKIRFLFQIPNLQEIETKYSKK